MDNKIRKAFYSLKGFLKNPHIPIPYKRMLFSAIVVGQSFVLYISTWIQQKKKKKEVYRHLIIQDYTGKNDFSK